MEIDITEREQGILLGLATSACLEASREGRSGPWVDAVKRIVAQVERALSEPQWRVAPTGGEPFGTKVTFWSAHWGIQRAVITRSPKPEAERDRFDLGQWQIVIFDSGMTHAPAEQLTMGWHPDAYGMDTPA